MKLESLLRRHTTLTNDDIKLLVSVENLLQSIANMTECDVFIDCLTKDHSVLVVAMAVPETAPSAYSSTVVGQYALAKDEPGVDLTFKTGIATRKMRGVTQEGNPVVQSVEPIYNQSRLIGVLIQEQRFQKSMESENVLGFDGLDQFIPQAEPASFAGYKDSLYLTKYIEEGLLIVDEKGRIRFCNQYAADIYRSFGFGEHLTGQSYRDFCLVNWDPSTSEKVTSQEVEISNKYFIIRHIHLNLERGGKAAVLIKDVTTEKEQERELAYKTLAMQEIHHRVKNNLQMVASILHLQGRRSRNTQTREALKKCELRIMSIAATHELLSKNGLNDVRIKRVLQSIRQNILNAVDPELELKIEIEGDDFELRSDKATNIALVVNEILQNSVKHAFVGRSHGKIKITIVCDQTICGLNICDDGCGYDVNQPHKDSLGISIVSSIISDKLHGQVQVDSDETGTRTAICWPIETTEETKI